MALAQLLLQTPMELVRQETETQLITSIQILIAILIFMESVLAAAAVALETILQVDSVIVLLLTYLMLAVLAVAHLGLDRAEITTQADLIR